MPATDTPDWFTCEVESITGDQARCLVEISGTWLPADIPASVLVSHGLTEGMRFRWKMSEHGPDRSEDVEPLPPPRLTEEEEAEVARLHSELQADIAAGNAWGLDPGESNAT